jgi:lipid-A-disaccharide synthase
MKGAMDLMLTLFPFEVDFYKKHSIPATFVGHPLADEIPLESNKVEARQKLSLDEEPFILAVLPGSRMGEINRLAPDFLPALESLHQQYPDWHFVIPMVNKEIKAAFETIKQDVAPHVPIKYIEGQSRTVMQASDQILMASGTAVLEGMLVGRPMVAAYRVAPMTARIIRTFKLIKSKYYTLPNNLADEYLVPELIQEDVTKENIFKEVKAQFLDQGSRRTHMLNTFNDIHKQLKQNASERAANALYNLLESKK